VSAIIMASRSEAATLRVAGIRQKFGADFYEVIGRRGQAMRKRRRGGFSDPEVARAAGRKSRPRAL
jgi:hypothetical protein